MIKAVPSMIAMTVDFEEKIGALRQPQVDVLLLEVNGAIFGDLMLDREPLYGVQQLGLDAQNLKVVGIDPGAPFLVNPVGFRAHHIILEAIRLVFALLEAHEPGCLPAPLAQAFTRY